MIPRLFMDDYDTAEVCQSGPFSPIYAAIFMDCGEGCAKEVFSRVKMSARFTGKMVGKVRGSFESARYFVEVTLPDGRVVEGWVAQDTGTPSVVLPSVDPIPMAVFFGVA